MKNSFFTVPNLLSLLRLAMIPFLAATYASEWYFTAGVLLVLSGLTDLLDGIIARKFNQISDAGKFLDPLADKLTLAAMVFALFIKRRQLWPMLVVLVIKEVMTLSAALVLFRRGTRPSESKIFGKVSTFALYVALFYFMVGDILEKFLQVNIIFDWLVWALTGLCCLFMILAMCQYVPIFRGIVRGTYNVETERFEGDNQ